MVDPARFPHGFEPLTKYAHARKLKMGIYTSVGNTTCAGYTGSLNHEAVDARSFAKWGFDFASVPVTPSRFASTDGLKADSVTTAIGCWPAQVKHDTCMSAGCSVHNGCVQDATRRMRDALHEAGSGRMIYYLDAGNPTNVMKLYNPKLHHVAKLDECIAQNPTQLSWRWATELDGAGTRPGKGPHMIKSIFVRQFG